ncbi:Uncharacterised protein [Zhongshania aliphaticivorans]|uniref:RNA polymerase sigma-70 region 2 domain-containing protein n=1 Tax=Zhongshania aliphaticivorans TaxID=1470434 RepID=A0A5S9QAJ2_9GAMM|nr:sigma-70 family RNA polymerase sigma factor [Zhongshania aliphaticivorans]CAA0102281.1 Uncharacterised protein [Zhongshania aliphaticivorans]CAA0114429.1 Uncharacterised protein [Zhongshania aliphaticivorans]
MALSNVEVDALIVAMQSAGPNRKAAVAKLYLEFSAKIQLYLTIRGIKDSEAEDLMHEIFIALIRRSSSFTPCGKGRGWLWAVTRSMLTDKQRSTPKVALSEFDDNLAFSSADIDEARLKACIEGQMHQFTRTEPESTFALSLVMDDHLELSAVADILGRSYGATREFMRQCKIKLNRYIQDCLTS